MTLSDIPTCGLPPPFSLKISSNGFFIVAKSFVLTWVYISVVWNFYVLTTPEYTLDQFHFPEDALQMKACLVLFSLIFRPCDSNIEINISDAKK